MKYYGFKILTRSASLQSFIRFLRLFWINWDQICKNFQRCYDQISRQKGDEIHNRIHLCWPIIEIKQTLPQTKKIVFEGYVYVVLNLKLLSATNNSVSSRTVSAGNVGAAIVAQLARSSRSRIVAFICYWNGLYIRADHSESSLKTLVLLRSATINNCNSFYDL